jgi:UDP-N-acetylmuramoyl-tripeptide--D-alanyl-D-alanine ligase
VQTMNQDKTVGMMPMTLQEIAQAVRGRVLVGGTSADSPSDLSDETGKMATSVFSDSRQLREGSVFVAIPGERVDGHRFVPRIAQSGAVAAIVEHPVDEASVPQIVVEQSVKALGLLARHNIDRRRESGEPFTIVGITGSVGKTTTKDLLSSMLGRLGNTIAPVGSFNNEIGLPLTALKVNSGTRFFVAEMGASHIGEIAYLTSIAPPDISIALKVGVAHLGEFGSVENIAKAKSEIVQGLLPDGVAVLNANDPRVAAMTRFAPGKVLWFGLPADEGRTELFNNGQTLDMTAEDISVDALDHPTFTLHDRDEQVGVNLAISGEHNVMNALAAATVAHDLGLSLQDVAASLAAQRHISPHRMAMSTVHNSGVSFTLIDDSFNANPDSTRAGLRALGAWGANDTEKPYRVAVLGAMLELGSEEIALHRQIGEECANLGMDALIAVGGSEELAPLASALAEGASSVNAGQSASPSGDGMQVLLAEDAGKADEMITGLAERHPRMVVLLKGSHVSGLSALAERWEHESDDGVSASENDGEVLR